MSSLAIAEVLTGGAAPSHLFIPAQIQRPPVVLVHGLSTRPERLVQHAANLAGRHGVPLLVPDFSTPTFKGYQRLEGTSGPHSAAKALIAAVRQAVERHDWPTCKFHLMGFSAGAQFAHRFALHYPQHLLSLTAAAPGWYTFLDHDTAYPLGLKGPLSPSPQDIEQFLNLPIMTLVGESDTRRDDQLRTSGDLDRSQGRNRLERALRWHQHLHETAEKHAITGRYTFASLPRTAHSLGEAVKAGGLMEQLFGFVLNAEPDTPSCTTCVPEISAPPLEQADVRDPILPEYSA